MNNQQAIIDFQKAREHYLARSFAVARSTMQRYRQTIDYGQFEQSDRRDANAPHISVVIVSYKTNRALLECLDSVFKQQGPCFEIILVDNGGNESIHAALAKLPLLWIKPPINLLPSEGRNIGAHYVLSDLLVFLDDDALMAPGYLAAACQAMAGKTILGLRGRVLPKTPITTNSPPPPKHYDLGDTLKLAKFSLEGNMVIRASVFKTLGGFDPLMFGHEGEALTKHCRTRFGDSEIFYTPALVIHHDWAQDDRLAAKRKRQALGQDYLQYLKEHNLNAGLSILVRAGGNLAAASEFLASLVRHNTYKPIEVLLIADDPHSALAIVRPFLRHFFIRLLSAKTSAFSRISSSLRYDSTLIVDVPTTIKTDCLVEWVERQKAYLANTLLCPKERVSAFADILITTPLTELAQIIGLKPSDIEATSNASAPQLNTNTLEATQNLNERHYGAATITNPKLTNDEFVQRYGWLKPPVLNKKIQPLENNSDNFNNKEVHRCNLFSPYRPTKKKRESSFKILALVSDRLQECLSYDADLITFDLPNWEAQLAARPSFVLFGSDSKALQIDGDAALLKFFEACRSRKIPTVFWHTDAREHCSMYQDLASLFDYVGAVESESVAYYVKHTKASVRLLEHAIQPVLHNAVRSELPQATYSNMHYFFDGWADLIEFRNDYSAFLQPLSDIGLHIFDSKWQFMKNKLPETPQFIKNIHGALDYPERLTAIKQFDVCIMPTPSMKSTSSRVLEALEVVASKRVVLFRGTADLPMLDGLAHFAASDEEFLVQAKRLIDYPAYRDECAHKAWRTVHTHHTYVNRLNTMAEWLGLPERIEQFPSVASITVTKRPELLITNAKSNFLSQTAPHKEWIIVLNTLDVRIEEIETALADVPNVRIYQVASDKNIGFCLNMGISKCRSDYWAKMDDDDFYGPNYLLDYLLNANSISFDLTGMLPAFTYLESENAVYFRHPGSWNKTCVMVNDSKAHMCGATFFGVKSLLHEVRFSESIRSAVDSTWYSNCVSNGISIVISDSYNMTIFRASDKTRHTWRFADEDLKKNALYITKGKGSVIINV